MLQCLSWDFIRNARIRTQRSYHYILTVIEDSCSGNQKESGVLVEERRQAVDEMGVAGPDYTGLGS